MTRYKYEPLGTCSELIQFDLDGNIVRNITFVRGCDGNTQGISALANGMDAYDLINRLDGIMCGNKATSCPDQLSKAVKHALEGEADTKSE